MWKKIRKICAASNNLKSNEWKRAFFHIHRGNRENITREKAGNGGKLYSFFFGENFLHKEEKKSDYEMKMRNQVKYIAKN